MDSYYKEWLDSGAAWMKAYRKRVLRKYIHFILPAVIILLAAIAAGATAVNDGSAEDIAGSAFAGALMGGALCFVFLLCLLPGLSPQRMRRNINRAVKLLQMSETELEQLGREMLDARKDSARVLDYQVIGPNSKKTPARFLLSPGYACLWGGYPLVILVRLSDVAEIRAEKERKTAVTHGAKTNTYHSFHLHTIIFYYKNSEQDGDNGMGFFDETIRDKVFDMLQKQCFSPTLQVENNYEDILEYNKRSVLMEKQLPPAIQKIYETHTMHDYDFFAMLNALDWSKQGDDDLVLEPLIDYLAEWPDEVIFTFENKMSELLYAIDDPALAKNLYESEYFSADDFLYSRCVALINGRAYYNAVLNKKKKLRKNMEFESLLYAPAKAWARKHKKDPSQYPHFPDPSYETGSNRELWKD